MPHQPTIRECALFALFTASMIILAAIVVQISAARTERLLEDWDRSSTYYLQQHEKDLRNEYEQNR